MNFLKLVNLKTFIKTNKPIAKNTMEKEEAERIVELYEFTDYYGQSPEYAKQCALIHVEGIIEAFEHQTWENQKIISFYYEVKKQIELL